jgi:hypothetical protein
MKTRVFNVGAYRRKVGGSEDAEFFDAANKAAAAKREELAWTVLNELLAWLRGGEGDVGIFDATNTTDQRRRLIIEHCNTQQQGQPIVSEISVLFIESICDDPEVLENNIRQKIVSSPDYTRMSADQVRISYVSVVIMRGSQWDEALLFAGNARLQGQNRKIQTVILSRMLECSLWFTMAARRCPGCTRPFPMTPSPTSRS